MSDTKTMQEHQDNELYLAVIMRDPIRLIEALDAGADIDARNEHGRTALHCAASTGDYLAAKELLRRGANPNIPNKRGDTPLHVAAGKIDHVMMLRLIEAGADPNATDSAGLTASDQARMTYELALDLLRRPEAYLRTKNGTAAPPPPRPGELKMTTHDEIVQRRVR